MHCGGPSGLPSSRQCLTLEQVLRSTLFQTDSWETMCEPSLALTLGAAAQQGQLTAVDRHVSFPHEETEAQTATRSVSSPRQAQRWVASLGAVAVGQCCSSDHTYVLCWSGGRLTGLEAEV